MLANIKKHWIKYAIIAVVAVLVFRMYRNSAFSFAASGLPVQSFPSP
jgi:hypothetical protein